LPVAPADVWAADLGGLRVYDLHAEGDALTFHVQGAPQPGPADLVLHTADGDRVVRDAFVYDPPLADVGTLAAVGASLTMGVQGGVPSQRGALMSPSAQVARALGVHHPLPLLVDGLFPSI